MAFSRLAGLTAVTKAFLSRRGAGALLTALAIAISGAAQDKTLPKELLQYIQDAKRQGVNDARIRKEAVAVGWAESLVDEVLASAKTAKPPQAAAQGTGAGVTPALEVNAQAPDPALPAPPAKSPQGNQSRAMPAVSANFPQSGNAPESHGSLPDDYQIGAGDILQVSVWKEPDISVPNVAVRPDGMITVPLIKEVAVAGLTPRQAEKVIVDRLATFLNDANVTVVVAASNSKKIYIVGAVRKEGPLPYTYRMTVMQALSEAGGLTEYAKRKRIYILRTESGKDYRLDFNYDEVVKGERMEQNIPLLPGDTLIIPQ